jgi:predicted amidohydrolase YtcJ
MALTRLIGVLTMVGLLAGAVSARDEQDQPRSRERRDGCSQSLDLLLVNGRIHTMDAARSVVSWVMIKDGRVAAVGTKGAPSRSPCTTVIDLKGHTAIPGLIDNHVHFLRLENLAGYDTRELETAFDLGALKQTIAAKAAKIPPGELISAIGGIHPNQFVERRLPTLPELDEAAPAHPVYLSVSSTGPGVVNSAAKRLFGSFGVAVGANGEVAAGEPTTRAFDSLRARITLDQQKRQLRDEMVYALSVGLTSVFDQGGSVPGSAFLDPVRGYDAVLALTREGPLTVRVRIFFPALDTKEGNPQLVARLDHAFRDFGGDDLRVTGLGEWLVSGDSPTSPIYEPAARLAAQRGWLYQQHSLGLPSHVNHVAAWERVNAQFPIADLHWSLGHANNIDLGTINRLKAMGAGVAAHGWMYLWAAPTAVRAGPPYRMLLDSGVKVGAGSDGARISTLNPWPMIYYMVTGLGSAGTLVNEGQQITREEAIYLYTEANGWFAREESNFGSLSPGKFGDVAVLDRDFFDAKAVPNDSIRSMKSLLTVVGGRVVHSAGPFAGR